MHRRRAVVVGILVWLFATAPLTPQSVARQDPDPAQSAISGVVTDGSSHAPLRGVTVSLHGPASTAAVTDSKGRFVFRRLKAGSYSLIAERGGYGSGTTWSLIAGASQIVVGKKEWVSDLPIELWRLGSISGTVRDEAGEAVVGVPVRALIQVWLAGHRHWASGPVAWTDDRGMYRLAGLRRGHYVVSVPNVQMSIPDGLPSLNNILGENGIPLSAAPRPTQAQPSLQLSGAKLVQGTYAVAGSLDGSHAYPSYFYPNARTLTDALAVEIGDGEEGRNVDVAIQPVRARAISGRLTGAVPPLDWYQISLVPGSAEAVGAQVDQAVTVSKGDGSFVLPSVPEGSYTLQVTRTLDTLRATGWAGVTSLPDVPWVMNLFSFKTVQGDPALGQLLYYSRWIGPWQYTLSKPESSATPVDEYSAIVQLDVQSDMIELPVELKRSAVLSGRVVREDGQPIVSSSYTRVSADPASGSANLGSTHHVPLDAQGRFTIDGLKAGEYFLRVFGDSIKTIAAPDGDHTDRPFFITPGGATTDIVITTTTQGATLSGEVRDRNERVLNVGVVVLFPMVPHLWQDFGLEPVRIRTSTFFGRAGYQIARIPAGEYYVVALDPGLENAWQEAGFFAKMATVAERVTLQPGEKKILSLHQREVAR